MVTMVGSRTLEPEEAFAARLEMSRSFRERQEREAHVQALSRRPPTGEAASVRFAMRCVEQRIVKALWVLEITTEPDGPRRQRRNGLGYIPDAVDHWGEAVAKGGWQAPPPRPAVPSSREIDAAHEAKAWIEWLDDEQARLLTVAAQTKRGDRKRRVQWERVKSRLRIPDETPIRTLQDRYDRALRTIVAEMTLARVG